ncbi:MAG: hypothetical protein Q8Q09_24155 [Deltaproteobacteria bacterium]|nr:hypothetical protein [Deltaproteobacteria bacterium]
MIERVVLHQSRFRTPGLVPDARGVALGPTGLVLLQSAERLVSFLRAAGEEGALDEMLDAMRILQMLSPLRTREMIVEVQASSSHRMDRISAVARLVGGMVFTGSGRHFVKYRDAQAPFGYDAGELLADPGDIALYHDRFSQAYKLERTLGVRDLILRLAPVHVPRARVEAPRMIYALTRIGLGESIVGYLARWNAPARVALVEWERGGTSTEVERAYLLQLQQPQQRFVQLLRSLPGVKVFVPDGERTAVEYGHRHPIPLSSCAPLFASEEMVLFRAGGDGAVVLPQRPPFIDVQAVTTIAAPSGQPVANVKLKPIEASFSLPLTVVPATTPPRRVSALVVDGSERDALGRALAVLPPSALARIQAAFTENAIYLYGPEGVQNLPLGKLYEEIGAGVFVPLGMTLSPPLPPEVLRQIARIESGFRVFVTGGAYPLTSVPESAFVPATRLLVSDIPVHEDSVITPPLDGDRPLPDLWPTPPGMLAAMTSPGARGALPPPRDPSAEMLASGAPSHQLGPGTGGEGHGG